MGVVQVEFARLRPPEVGSAADLPEPGHSGSHTQTLMIGASVEGDLSLALRARTDETHRTADDIEQLRQLVDRGLAQNMTEPGDPRIGVDLEQRLRCCPWVLSRSVS